MTKAEILDRLDAIILPPCMSMRVTYGRTTDKMQGMVITCEIMTTLFPYPVTILRVVNICLCGSCEHTLSHHQWELLFAEIDKAIDLPEDGTITPRVIEANKFGQDEDEITFTIKPSRN